MHDGMAAAREAARKEGGEELVAKMDAALEKEKVFSKKVADMVAEITADITDEDEKKMAIVAVNEALSKAYASATVMYGQHMKLEDSQVIVLAIRSLVNNVNIAQADAEVDKSGVLDLIKKAKDAEQARKGDK